MDECKDLLGYIGSLKFEGLRVFWWRIWYWRIL